MVWREDAVSSFRVSNRDPLQTRPLGLEPGNVRRAWLPVDPFYLVPRGHAAQPLGARLHASAVLDVMDSEGQRSRVIPILRVCRAEPATSRPTVTAGASPYLLLLLLKRVLLEDLVHHIEQGAILRGFANFGDFCRRHHRQIVAE